MLNGYWVSLSSDELIEARAKEKGVTLSNAEACLELLDTARTLANGGLNVILDILVFENAVSDRLIDVLGDLSLVVALLHVPLSAYPARVKTRNDRAIACGRDNDVFDYYSLLAIRSLFEFFPIGSILLSNAVLLLRDVRASSSRRRCARDTDAFRSRLDAADCRERILDSSWRKYELPLLSFVTKHLLIFAFH